MKDIVRWVDFVKYLEEIVPTVDIAVVRDFTESVKHPVRLLSLRGWSKDRDVPWLVCACDVREALTRVVRNEKCPHRERARQILLQEIREQHYARWCAMKAPDIILDVLKMYKADTYIGSHGLEIPPGVLSLIELLVNPRPESGRLIGSCYPVMKVEDLWSGLFELERKKLLSMDGLAIDDYVERFQFPKDLRIQLERWIIENDPGCGFGGVGTIWSICRDVAERTGWTQGETIFGKDNIPWMTDATKERCWSVWIPALDIRLTKKDYPSKDVVIEEIPIEFWIGWLQFIARDIATEGKDTAS